LQRRFLKEAPVQEIFDFVRVNLPDNSDFVLFTSFPKRVLDNRTETIATAGLDNVVLIMEPRVS